MPTYAYRCGSCGVQFDRHQKFSDQALTKCPECGEKSLRKLFQPVGIVFKGSGFYATDHRSPSGASTTSGSDKAESASKSEKPAEPPKKDTKADSD